MCIVFISEQTATFALYNVNWSVFCNRDEKCLLRGTNWVFKWNSLRFVFKWLNQGDCYNLLYQLALVVDVLT
jgi:hypothetical protein